MRPESETLSVCSTVIPISHDCLSTSGISPISFSLSSLSVFLHCAQFWSPPPSLPPSLLPSTLCHAPQSPIQPQFPAPHAYYYAGTHKGMCICVCIIVGLWQRFPQVEPCRDNGARAHCSADSQANTHHDLWVKTHLCPHTYCLHTDLHSTQIHLTFCMHTHKNTKAYFHSSQSPYIQNGETHTRLACFCCVIGVLVGTVAAGESVLETQNRLRLVKQIITSPHWHAGSSQLTNKKDRVGVYVTVVELIWRHIIK